MAQHDDRGVAAATRSAGKAAEARELEIDTALDALLTSVTGRELVSWLLKITGVGQQPFAPHAPDLTAFRCGELNVGQQLLSRILRVNPQAYANMLKEPLNGNDTKSEPDAGTDSEPGALAYPDADPFADARTG